MFDFFIYGFKGKMFVVTLVLIFISIVLLLHFAINVLGLSSSDTILEDKGNIVGGERCILMSHIDNCSVSKHERRDRTVL